MRVLQVHNRYRFSSGEETVFDNTIKLLKRNGDIVVQFTYSSHAIVQSSVDKIRAFFQGIYSRNSKKAMESLLDQEKPDIIEIHNIYPLISPSILVASKKAGVPVVMRVHNYRLICPTGNFFTDGEICERCSNGREYWGIIKNCRANRIESIAYVLWTVVARKLRFFHENATLFLALTQFSKQCLIRAGYPEERIAVLPNAIPISNSTAQPHCGEYVAYSGGFMPKKGIDILLAAAHRTGLPVHLAGDYSTMPDALESAPPNVVFLGWQSREKITDFYLKARFLVIPSVWYEVCPMVILEAMGFGLPVIASRVGGLSELVEDGKTGFLFEPKNIDDLAAKMKILWNNPGLCSSMGHLARQRAVSEYSEEVHYRRLMTMYTKAISMNSPKSH